jgi:hypothetical protein
MNLPNEAPRLPLWPFLAGDAILLLAAWLLASQAPSPLDTATLATVAILVGIGAFVALIPFLLNYARRQDTLLIERQNQIAALARDITATAEQISIASGSLQGIAESATRLLKHADQLPARLQEKINEFKTRLNEVAVAENEALAQEINMLRASETERLETALAAIRDAASELATLETAVRQHALGIKDALAGAADVWEKSAHAAQESVTRFAFAQTESREKFAAAETAARATLAQAVDNALARLDEKLAAFSKLKIPPPPQWGEHPAPSRESKPLPPLPPPPPAEPPPPKPQKTAPRKKRDTTEATAATETTETADAAATTNATTDNAVADDATTSAATTDNAVTDSAAATASSSAASVHAGTTSDSITSAGITSDTAVETPPPPPPPSFEPPPPPAPAKPRQSITAKRRSAHRELPPDEALPGLDLPPVDDFNQDAPEAPELSVAISADGITRLIVTAYIGIGNKLHIRGEGPGLSWDKGVPLQFISIGKWRWECPDADAPISFKLYKNDEIECAALGRQTLRPGCQHEVPANF